MQILDVQTNTLSNTRIFNIYNGKTGQRPDRRVLDGLDFGTLYRRTIITGDMNAHHPLWNSNKRPTRADKIVELIEEHNYTLLNTPDEPTFLSHNGVSTSVIDLTLTSPDLQDSIRNWAIMDETTGSDHLPISIDIHPDKFDPPSATYIRYNSKKTDWAKFDECIEEARSRVLQTLRALLRNTTDNGE